MNKATLLNDLKNLGVDPKGTLKVHVSYKAIGDVEGRGETVLDALMKYMKDGLLVLASHTWDNVREDNPIMHPAHTKSCVGALTELFRKRPGVYRSLHPTHAVAAYGKDAEAFVQGDEKLSTPCGEGGAYHKLWERNAQILLIGVNFSRNTFIHGIEEWDGATGTIKDTFEDYYVVAPTGIIHTPQRRHCAPIGSETFPKVEPYAYKEGILTFGKFGQADTRLMHTQPLRTLIAGFLKENPAYLGTY